MKTFKKLLILLTMGLSLMTSCQVFASDLQCVSRDNDNHPPYIPGRLRDDLSFEYYRDLVFSSLSECENQLNLILAAAGVNLICASRDRDGSVPMNIYIIGLNGKTMVVPGTVYLNMKQCNSALTQGRASAQSFLTCSSHNNDGKDPWHLLRYNADGSVNRSEQQFSGFEECMKSFATIEQKGSYTAAPHKDNVFIQALGAISSL